MTTVTELQLIGNTRMYGRINTNNRGEKRVLDRYKEMILELGFQAVHLGVDLEQVNIIEMNSVATQQLYILPKVKNIPTAPTATSTFILSGHKFILHPPLPINILPNNTKIVMYNNNVLAHVVSNCTILYTNPFPLEAKVNPVKHFLQAFRRLLIGAHINVQKVEIKKKTYEELLEMNKKKFLANVEAEIKRKTEILENIQYDITAAQETILRKVKEFSMISGELTNLTNSKDKVGLFIEDKIKEILKLTVVKKVDLDENGIFVDFGDIHIKQGAKEYYIGNITCSISPNKITFDNLNNKKKTYVHPHINSGSPCFGSYATDIYKMLADLNLSKLVFTIAQYLRTYNHQSKYHDLELWK